MPGLIGKKLGMTSVFDENGNQVACTVLQAGPCVVTQVKTLESDGYKSLQIAFDEKKEKHTTKALAGHFKKAGTAPKRKVVELKGFIRDWKLGDIIDVEYFKDDKWVDVVGETKGKGFQGVVKRHGFSGVGGQTHGQHDRLRAPGSMGASSWPSRVFKGMRMGGRTGGNRVKTTNLEVVRIINEQHLMLIKGSVPGAVGSYVIIQSPDRN